MPPTAPRASSVSSVLRRATRTQRLLLAVSVLLLVLLPVVSAIAGGPFAALVGAGLSVLIAGLAVVVALLIEMWVRQLLLETAARAQQEQTRRTLARLERMVGKQGQRLRTLPKSPASIDSVKRAAVGVNRQVQATANLFSMVPVTAGVPAMGSWTASADLVVALVDAFVDERPQVVVEAGSGVSTLFLALAAAQHGIDSRIIALEHDEAWAEHTRALLARHGVGHRAEVRHAPLAPAGIEGHETPWYDARALEDLHEIGLVLVDGPPGVLGKAPRFPMVPLVHERLARACTILVDDTNRESDREVVDSWAPWLADFEQRTLPLDKGAVVLRRRG